MLLALGSITKKVTVIINVEIAGMTWKLYGAVSCGVNK